MTPPRALAPGRLHLYTLGKVEQAVTPGTPCTARPVRQQQLGLLKWLCKRWSKSISVQLKQSRMGSQLSSAVLATAHEDAWRQGFSGRTGRSLLHGSLLWPKPQHTACPTAPVAPRVLHPFLHSPGTAPSLSSELGDAETLNSAHKPPVFSTQLVHNPVNSPWTSHPAASLDPAEERNAHDVASVLEMHRSGCHSLQRRDQQS